MVQFNLLPEVKIKYIKARRQKRLVIVASFFVTTGSLAVLMLAIVYVYLFQGAQLASVDNRIEEAKNSIGNKQSQVDDINKVLTVQNQLTALDGLHAEKPLVSRVFDYLARVTPAQVTISNVNVNNVSGSEFMTIQGSTDTLETINKFVDTLKFTTFSVAEDQKETVFTEVVLSSFSRDGAGASYSINLRFDPMIFSSEYEADALVVPKGIITTRSEIGRPIIQTEVEQQNNAPLPVEGNN